MVKRYEIASSSSMPIITEHPVGRYVLAADYDSLQARLSAVEKERATVGASLADVWKQKQEYQSRVRDLQRDYDALAQREAALSNALLTINNMSQEDLGEAIKSGDMVRMLAAATRLFNQCRDVAQHALSPHQPEGKAKHE